MNENEVVAKPMTLLREEFVENLIKACNNSGLPFFVVESIVKDLLSDIRTASQKQLESDNAKYNEALLKMQSNLSDGKAGD